MTRFAKVALAALAATSFACSSSPGGPDGGSSTGNRGSSTGSRGSSTGAQGGSSGVASSGSTGATGGSSGAGSSAGTTGGGSSASASGGSSGGSATGGGLPFDQLGSALATALCQSSDTCVPAAAYYQGGCAANAEATLLAGSFTQVAVDIDAGLVVYDPVAAAACIQSEGTLGCGAFGAAEPAACVQTFIGQLPLGASCYDDLECDAGYCTTSTSASCPGVCTSYLAAGASCADGGSCAPPASCVIQSSNGATSGSCTAPGQAGASCGPYGSSSSPGCAPNLVCVNGSCAQPGGAGSPCNTPGIGGQAGGLCQTGLYCDDLDGGTLVCVPQIAQGQPCGQNSSNAATVNLAPGQGGQCAAGLVCAGFSYSLSGSGPTPGVCLAPSDVGGQCVLGSDGGSAIQVSGCLYGLACVSGQCQIPPTSGACLPDPTMPCNPEGYYCDPSTQRCQPLLAAGAACNPSVNDCLAGYCDPTSHCSSPTSCTVP